MNTKWTYKILESGPKIFDAPHTERMTDELNRLGAQGWELVSAEFVPLSGNTRLYLKKPEAV
ncbi:DUF4177 domain-containing protein [Montanilutibacter psychrotolerans]|uniref:DUF4177 domain-containing protein n=1 Tax=Montanilutibacter psychrotolerans TaxID=1327343 RepID=A0A3M8SK59_9GAMM|nr:DUF4177 domain-containing protein [Lysobacter psychrotolerans]RNF81737.1 DUF4177 domain-containing protein [Lysobacter psychrotolerans]